MSELATLELEDRLTASDLAVYVSRARKIESDGAIRLQASGTTLAAWVGVRKGRGVLGEGTVVGLRVIALRTAVPEPIDVLVPLAAVSDRLARIRDDELPHLEIPPMRVRTSWAAQSPPRSGWNALAEIEMGSLMSAARAGIAEIAQGTPPGAGAAAVESLQQRVWNRAIPGLPAGADGLIAGAALGMYTLGFGVGDHATVFGTARWHRLSTSAGHILVR